MDNEWGRRRVVRLMLAGGAALPLLHLMRMEEAQAKSGRGDPIVITVEDERAFADKLRSFAENLTEVDWALLRLTLDFHNFHPDRGSNPPQSDPEDFAGSQKKACTCTLQMGADGWVMIWNANCPIHGHLVVVP